MRAQTRFAAAAALGAIFLGAQAFQISGAGAPGKEAGILDLRKSPHAKLQNIPVRSVTLGESAAQAARAGREVELTFIPYSVWANREDTPMLVWVRYAAE
jgi:hypothetical protein